MKKSFLFGIQLQRAEAKNKIKNELSLIFNSKSGE